MLTDEFGVPSWRASYEAFGAAHVSTDPDGYVPTPDPEIDFNIRFPGQYYDAESGLHYNRFRTYDPVVGRYISADPIGQFGGNEANVYSYSVSNPLNLIDPLGLWNYAREYGTTGHGLTQPISDAESKVDQVYNDSVGSDATVTYSTNGEHGMELPRSRGLETERSTMLR
jgi:RHS repeat-associated protein